MKCHCIDIGINKSLKLQTGLKLYHAPSNIPALANPQHLHFQAAQYDVHLKLKINQIHEETS